MNTLHLFITFALIHSPFALAQTIQAQFDELVSQSNQEVPKCKKILEHLNQLSEQKDLTNYFKAVISDSFYPDVTAKALDLYILNQTISLESLRNRELQYYCGLIPIWDKLKTNHGTELSRQASLNFLKTNLEKTNNLLSLSLNLHLLELILKDDPKNSNLVAMLKPIIQQKDFLKSKILEKIKPKPFEAFRLEMVETQNIRLAAYEVFKKIK